MSDPDLWWQSKKKEHEAEFQRGMEDGRKATFTSELLHGLAETLGSIVPGETIKHKSYEAGWREGRRQPGQAPRGESGYSPTEAGGNTYGLSSPTSSSSKSSSGIWAISLILSLFVAAIILGIVELLFHVIEHLTNGAVSTAALWGIAERLLSQEGLVLIYLTVSFVIAYLIARRIV